MRRTDLTEATMQGWARLDAAQRDPRVARLCPVRGRSHRCADDPLRLDAAHRQRLFEAFLKAALRLDALALRAWLRRRLRNPPLAATIDPARFTISIALLMRAAREAPGEAATGPDRDEDDSG